MELFCLVLYLVYSFLRVTSAFEWTSASFLPNGTVIPACPGQDVTLAWSYTTSPDEHLNNVEWHYTSTDGSSRALATQVMGSFFTPPGSSQHLQFLPNAGLRLQNVHMEDSGIYSVQVNLDLHGNIVRLTQTVEVQVSDQPLTTDGQLHVEMLQDAVYDNTTGEFHVQLGCGQFLDVWQSRASVVWKTPTNQTLQSTAFNNGRFLLSVQNPVSGGEYHCAIDDTSPASLCVQSGSPLHRGATISVDIVQARLTLMDARMRSVLQKETKMETELNIYKTQLSTLQQKNTALENQLNSTEEKDRLFETQLSDVQTRFNDYRQKVAALENQLNIVQQKNADLESRLAGVQQENVDLKQHMDDMQQNVTAVIDTNSKLAIFHARLGSNTNFSSGDRIVLKTVTFNQGHAYSATTGEFTAPYNGFYYFTATSRTNSVTPGQSANLFLMVDFSWVAQSYAEGSGTNVAQSTCNYASHLTKGQRVWMRANGEGSFSGGTTTFTGFLLRAD